MPSPKRFYTPLFRANPKRVCLSDLKAIIEQHVSEPEELKNLPESSWIGGVRLTSDFDKDDSLPTTSMPMRSSPPKLNSFNLDFLDETTLIPNQDKDDTTLIPDEDEYQLPPMPPKPSTPPSLRKADKPTASDVPMSISSGPASSIPDVIVSDLELEDAPDLVLCAIRRGGRCNGSFFDLESRNGKRGCGCGKNHSLKVRGISATAVEHRTHVHVEYVDCPRFKGYVKGELITIEQGLKDFPQPMKRFLESQRQRQRDAYWKAAKSRPRWAGLEDI